jgi:hypothetical protein
VSGGDVRRPQDQARLTGLGAAAAGPHWPVTFDVTFGGLPAPWETTSVVRVQVAPPLLTETTVVLVPPAGRLP